MLIVASGSPAPIYAPAMKGLSSGIFEKTTSLAAAKPLLSISACAISLMTSPRRLSASMLIPALRDAALTEAQTDFVCVKTSGRESIKTRSPSATPFWTSAEKPPTKSTRQYAPAASSAFATSIAADLLCPARRVAAGEIAIRLLVIGTPYFPPISSQTSTRFRAWDTIL